MAIPTIANAKHTLGKQWFLLYDTCECDPCKCQERYIKALYGDIWESPSDKIKDKLCMKPPFTRKSVQAKTHQAILDIGFRVEQDILNQHEMEKQMALEVDRKIVSEKFHGSILEQIKDAEAVQRGACNREIQKLTEEFESNLADQIRGLQQQMEKEFQTFSDNHNNILQNQWENKLKTAVEETTQFITKELLEELARQQEILEKHFKAEFKKKEIERRYEEEKQTTEFAKTMQEARHRLECKNIANMMYILCMERRRCLEDKELLKDYYMNIEYELNIRLSTQKKIINDLRIELGHQIKQVDLRETCCLEIIRQFQKFINFALRAAPTQAQFLLSIQKLMSFELAGPPVVKENTCPPSVVHPCDTILPWSHNKSIAKSEEIQGLQLEDYHDCFNELAIPKREEDIQLPAFNYKDKLYIRQDFRNMISQGITLTPSHDMWSEDIELLIETLRESVSHLDKKSSKSLGSTETEKKDETSGTQTELDFEKPAGTKEQGTQPLQSSSKHHRSHHKKKSVLKSKTLNLPQMESTVGSETRIVDSNVRLLATCSSLDIILQKGMVKALKSKPSFDEEEGEEREEEDDDLKGTGDSSMEIKQIIPSDHEVRKSINLSNEEPYDKHEELKKTQRTSFSLSPIISSELKKDSGELKKASKISDARNSVTYLKESRQALLEPTVDNTNEAVVQRILQQQSTHPQLKEYCCEKCLKQHAPDMLAHEALVKYQKSTSIDSHKPVRMHRSETLHEKLIANTNLQPSSLLDSHVDEFYPDKLAKIYKPPKIKGKRKSSSQSTGGKRSKPVKRLEEEHISSEYEFCDNDGTIHRMRSFITTMSGYPDLIKLFTGCQR